MIIQQRDVDCRESYEIAIKMHSRKLTQFKLKYPFDFSLRKEYRRIVNNIKRLKWAIEDTTEKLKSNGN